MAEGEIFPKTPSTTLSLPHSTQDRVKVLETACRMDKLREKGMMSDVVLVCDGTEIGAHRLVLSAGCLYFRAMFACGVQEMPENKIELKGVNAKGLETVLHYIYAGKFPVEMEHDSTNLKSILVVADFLQLPSLVEYCREHLVRNMSLDNCLELLDISKSFLQGDQMQKYAGENYDKLQHTKRFLDLPVDHVLSLLNCAKEFQSTDMIMTGVIRWVKSDQTERKKHLNQLVSCINLQKLTSEFLHFLATEPLISGILEIIQMLYNVASLRLVESEMLRSSKSASVNQCTSAESPAETCTHVKIDFVVYNKDFTYSAYTYYYLDNLWSEMKPLTKVTTDWFAFCGIGNFIYYVEKTANNCKAFIKFHADINFNEFIEFPFERYSLYSMIDLRGKIYFHISTKLVSCDICTCDWQTICSDIPNTSSVLLTCAGCLYCICWDTQLMVRYHPGTKVRTNHTVPTGVNIGCFFKYASCGGNIYFHGDKETLNIYNCKKNEWELSLLPEGIWQLGEKWKFCSAKKELPCLFFIDGYKLIWEYYPKADFWKRVTSDPKCATDLEDIVIRS